MYKQFTEEENRIFFEELEKQIKKSDKENEEKRKKELEKWENILSPREIKFFNNFKTIREHIKKDYISVIKIKNSGMYENACEFCCFSVWVDNCCEGSGYECEAEDKFCCGGNKYYFTQQNIHKTQKNIDNKENEKILKKLVIKLMKKNKMLEENKKGLKKELKDVKNYCNCLENDSHR